MGGAMKFRRETKQFRRHLKLSFAQPLRQMTASLVLVMFEKTQKPKKKVPQSVSLCIQVESVLDHIHDFKEP